MQGRCAAVAPPHHVNTPPPRHMSTPPPPPRALTQQHSTGIPLWRGTRTQVTQHRVSRGQPRQPCCSPHALHRRTESSTGWQRHRMLFSTPQLALRIKAGRGGGSARGLRRTDERSDRSSTRSTVSKLSEHRQQHCPCDQTHASTHYSPWAVAAGLGLLAAGAPHPDAPPAAARRRRRGAASPWLQLRRGQHHAHCEAVGTCRESPSLLPVRRTPCARAAEQRLLASRELLGPVADNVVAPAAPAAARPCVRPVRTGASAAGAVFLTARDIVRVAVVVTTRASRGADEFSVSRPLLAPPAAPPGLAPALRRMPARATRSSGGRRQVHAGVCGRTYAGCCGRHQRGICEFRPGVG